MRERDLQGAGLVVSAFMLAAFVVGTIWRVADAGLDRDPSPARPESGAASGAEVRSVRHIEVPPGWRAEQIAQALERAGIGSAERFLRLVHDPSRARLGLRWAKLPSLEGYLHPGVYDVDADTTEAGLVEEMVARFDQSLTGAMRRRARALGLSVHEVVTLASIVQREMQASSEAPVISAVFHNRLRRGIELKANPTVVYALDSAREARPDRYWVGGGFLSREEVSFDSPYNTYARKGLPPGPIASPGPDALEAALYPADVDHLFFVGKGNGFHDFARTGREHVANVVRYRPGAVPKPQRRSELERLVRRLLSSFDGHVGVVVKDLTTGETVSVNADEYFTTASLYKLPVLWAAFEARERGRLSFARRLPIPQDALLQDTAEIQRRLGSRPTVAKAVREMIAVSSNGAGITLLRELGREKIDGLLRRHGVTDTSLSSQRMVTTPRDIARVLELMARGRAVSTRASAEMVRILGRQEIRDRLPRLLPKEARLAHKTGELDFTRHDAGILFTRDGPVVVVALTEDANPARASETIAYLGRLVFNYFERYRPVARQLQSGHNPACPASPFRPRARGPLSGKTIVLDPGHGGRDGGAVFAFPDGFVLKEKDVTLDVSLRLRDRLTALGAAVHLTRCRDVLPSVYARAALANTAGGDIVVSVHVNGSPTPSRNGTEVYYFLPDGKALADHLLGTFARPAIWETLSERLPLPNHGLHRRSLGLLTTTFAPTALTESLFMTHASEAAALRARGPRSRRAQIVRGHVLGILSYFGASRPVEPQKAARATELGDRLGRTEITVAATGDIALGSTPALPLHGPEALFAAVVPHLAGDVVLGNLETALALEGTSKCAAGEGATCFAFRAPPWYAYWLKRAGFTVLNLANNHSWDFGPEGAAETVLALDEAALAHTGRPGQVLRREIAGVRVAMVGFAPYRVTQNVLDFPAAQRLVRRADEWADVVIVSMHAGAEGAERAHVPDRPETFLGEPRGDPRAFARAVVDAGADLVVGHGPHVLRGIEWYRGRLVAYSLGNFAGYGNFSLAGNLGVSAVLQATLRTDGSWKRGRLVPLRLVDTGTPRLDPRATAVDLVGTLSREDFGERAVRMDERGEILPPLGVHAGQARRPRPQSGPSPRRVRRFEIVATGDLLVHHPISRRAYVPATGAYDFRPMLARIRPIVRRAELALCHVETPIGAGRPSGFPHFNAPTELAEAIAWAGWDVCSTTSNHSLDQGQLGVNTTTQALDRAGVAHVGTSRSPSEARSIPILEAAGTRVAFLAYTQGTNRIGAAQPWSVNAISLPRILSDARRARRRGADLVVVNLHWGEEYVHAPTNEQRTLARALLERRAVDVVVGQHAHVVQPIRKLSGRFVVFGQGNLLSNQTEECCPAAAQDGLIAVIRVRAVGRRATVTGVDYVPTRVRHPDFVVEPAGLRYAELAADGRSGTAEAEQLRASFERTVRVVGRSRGVGPIPRRLPSALTPREKAALLVVSALPAPPDVRNVLVSRWNRHLPRPPGSLVFVDQEGGATRAFPRLPPRLPASSYTSAAEAFAAGRRTGAALRRAGAHVDLAPVLDSPDGPLGSRHFADAALGLSFARGLAAAKAAACPKHFPGLGSMPISTDVAPARGVLRRAELRGFASAARAGVPCVMVGHAIYGQLGPRPASLEARTYRLLRSAGFDGIAVTDDLAVLGREAVPQSARLAIEAGADLVLVTSGRDAGRAIEALVPLARRGALDDRVARVLELRRSFGL